MKLLLKKMSFLNFKGIRNKTITFNPYGETFILGRNRSGKTTTLDGFLWVWFGKDSFDRADFNIKTLDKNNVAYPRIPHEVALEMELDGTPLILRKTYEEKWVKKTGELEPTFQGHDNKYYWNDVPMLEKDFKAKVNDIIREGQLKLLTNLSYFNTVLKWQDRRAALLQLVSGISDMEIAQDLDRKNGGYQHLINALLAKKSITEYKSELTAKIKKIKEESQSIPVRIEEATRALPKEEDYEVIEQQIAGLKEDLDTIESLLNSKSLAAKQRQEELLALTNEQNAHRTSLNTLENAIRNSVKDAKVVRENAIAEERRQLRSMEDEKSRNVLARKSDMERRTEIEQTKETLGRAWDTINKEVFDMDPKDCACPVCKRAFDAADVEAKRTELEKNFNADKSERLNANAKRGIALKKEAEELTLKINNLNALIEESDAQILAKKNNLEQLELEHTRLSQNESSEVADRLLKDEKVLAVKAAIKRLQEIIDAPAPEDNNDEAKQRKLDINNQISELNKKLAGKELRAQGLRRIEDLKSQEAISGQQTAELEGMLFHLAEFDKAKMDILESRINDKFQMVKFKLFNRNVNGTEEPTCQTLIDGVPYSDANTESRINASLDIINTFSQYYGIKVPVFIDNRESVTDIIPTELQVINLVVSPMHDELRVMDAESMMAEHAMD